MYICKEPTKSKDIYVRGWLDVQKTDLLRIYVTYMFLPCNSPSFLIAFQQACFSMSLTHLVLRQACFLLALSLIARPIFHMLLYMYTDIAITKFHNSSIYAGLKMNQTNICICHYLHISLITSACMTYIYIYIIKSQLFYYYIKCDVIKCQTHNA